MHKVIWVNFQSLFENNESLLNALKDDYNHFYLVWNAEIITAAGATEAGSTAGAFEGGISTTTWWLVD